MLKRNYRVGKSVFILKKVDKVLEMAVMKLLVPVVYCWSFIDVEDVDSKEHFTLTH
jgi:hypothetical protein